MTSKEERDLAVRREKERKDFLEDAIKAFEQTENLKTVRAQQEFKLLGQKTKLKLALRKEKWFVLGTMLLTFSWCIEKFSIAENEKTIAFFNSNRQMGEMYYHTTRQIYFEQDLISLPPLQKLIPKAAENLITYHSDKIMSQSSQIWTLINIGYGDDSTKVADEYSLSVAVRVKQIYNANESNAVKLSRFDSLINETNHRLAGMTDYLDHGIKRINKLRRKNSWLKTFVICCVIAGTSLLTVQKMVSFFADKKNFLKKSRE